MNRIRRQQFVYVLRRHHFHREGQGLWVLYLHPRQCVAGHQHLPDGSGGVFHGRAYSVQAVEVNALWWLSSAAAAGFGRGAGGLGVPELSAPLCIFAVALCAIGFFLIAHGMFL